MPDPGSAGSLYALSQSDQPDDRECAAREARNHPFNQSIQSILLDLIGDSDWRVRHAAADSLYARGGIQVVPDVLSALYDENNAGKRNAAIDVLMRFGSPIVPYLPEHLSTANADVRMFLLTLLGALRDRTYLPFVASCLQDPEQNVVSAAILALGRIGDGSYTPQLIEFLHSENLWYQFQAIEASGEMQDEALLPHLLSLVESSYCRRAAIKAIGNFQHPDAYRALAQSAIRNEQINLDPVNSLISLYHAHQPDEIRRQDQDAIRRACREVFQQKEQQILLNSVEGDDRSFQFSVAQILAFCSHQDAIERLLEFQSDPEFAQRATTTLQSLGYEDAASRIEPSLTDENPLQGIKDEDPTVRKKSAAQMGKEIREDYVEPLMAALADEDPHVRESAAEALRFYTSKQVTDALLSSLDDEDPWVRAAIYSSLPLENNVLLLDRLSKETPIGQAAILRVLRKADPDRAVPVLQSNINHENPEVRAAVCETLSFFPSQSTIELLEQTFDRDAMWVVRIAALRSLRKMEPPGFSSKLQQKLEIETDSLVKKEILSSLQSLQDNIFPNEVFDLLVDEELADDAYLYLRSRMSQKDRILELASHCRPNIRRIVRKSLG